MKSYRDLVMRCPRLGGEVPFSYCEREAGDLPCRQVDPMLGGRFPGGDLPSRNPDAGGLGAFLRPGSEGPDDDADRHRRGGETAAEEGNNAASAISPTEPPYESTRQVKMDLFDQQDERDNRPLADRMRPRSLDEYVGQGHLLGADGLLRRAVREDRIFSVIFWGPPGSGKTTLARILAQETKSHFISFSAVLSGVKEIRGVVDEASELWRLQRRKTILFVDEIHRFNKAQQDAFLPHVESGLITLIGATTENPSFEVIAPLLSRMRVLTLKPFTEEDLTLIVRRALADRERGLGRLDIEIDPEALTPHRLVCRRGCPFRPEQPRSGGVACG